MFGDALSRAGPPLPGWFLWPATAFFALATILWILRTPGAAGRYLIFACWVRFTLGSIHEFAYREAFPGLRWVAVGSLALIAIGLFVLDKRRIFSRPFVPVAVICLLMLISALINQGLDLAIDPILRFGFFILAAVAFWQSLETQGSMITRRLLFVFVQPIVFLIASIALGITKSGELDGSMSYIGGYYHEELFSLILSCAFLAAVLATSIGRTLKMALIAVALIGIYFTNYRTSIIAALPLAITVAMTAGPKAFRVEQRKFVRIVLGIFGAVAIVGAISAAGARYADLAAIGKGADLIRPPEQWSYEDQRVLSARPFIWSQYLYAYADAPPTQKIIGFGPDSWDKKFRIYAHNTVVSFLYELGVLGVAALLWLWISMFLLALKASPTVRPTLIAGHASFFLLNMATMPHWQLEGNIFYGLLCGYTIAKSRVAVRSASIGSNFPPGIGDRRRVRSRSARPAAVR